MKTIPDFSPSKIKQFQEEGQVDFFTQNQISIQPFKNISFFQTQEDLEQSKQNNYSKQSKNSLRIAPAGRNPSVNIKKSRKDKNKQIFEIQEQPQQYFGLNLELFLKITLCLAAFAFIGTIIYLIVQISVNNSMLKKYNQNRIDNTFRVYDEINYQQNTIRNQNQEEKMDYKTLQAKQNAMEEYFRNNREFKCDQYRLFMSKVYGNLYQFSVNHTKFRANSNANSFINQISTNITQTKYSQAINLLKLIHNIDSNGNLNVKDTPCQKGSEIESMLQSTMKSQTQRLNSEYQIDKYHGKQLRFCIVSNSYRNAQNGLLYRNIDSILQQDYTNYHVVYTDDHSPDRTGEVVVDYLKQKQVPEGKFKVKINPHKVGMMENIYKAITQDCKLGEIAVMLDGDDSFIGRNVLSLLNAVYQKQKVALIWNNFLQAMGNQRVSMGFSRDYSELQKSQNKFRQLHGFLSSHLKSFYVDLFRKIKIQDLKTFDGYFYGGASDTAMMFSMLEMANTKLKYIPEVVYQYRYDTGQIGMYVNKFKQTQALMKIYNTKPYENLKDFSFIEDAIKKLQNIE